MVAPPASRVNLAPQRRSAEQRRSARVDPVAPTLWALRSPILATALAGGALFGVSLLAGARLAAQAPDTALFAPSTSRVAGSRLAGEWLQASGGAIGRHALPSLAATFSRDLERGVFAGTQLELGWLRAARPTTTAQGVTAGLARALRAGPLTFRPGLAVMAGQAISTVDSGGYDWRGISVPYLGQTGYQDRPRLTRGATVGAGLQLGADVALFRGLHLTGSVRRALCANSRERGDGHRDRDTARRERERDRRGAFGRDHGSRPGQHGGEFGDGRCGGRSR